MKMNTTTNLLLATIAGSVLLVACSNTAEDQRSTMDNKMENVQDDLDEAAKAESQRAFNMDRNDALAKLRRYQIDIERELAVTDSKLAEKNMKADNRAEKEALRTELVQQKAQVENLINKVENSTEGNWINVKEENRTAGEKIEGWWQRFKQNVDKNTAADKDRDGQ